MIFAMAKINFATCLDSFIIVSGGPACSSLNLFALSLSCFRYSLPSCTELGGRLSLQTATMLATIVMICVMFSPTVDEGVGLRCRGRSERSAVEERKKADKGLSFLTRARTDKARMKRMSLWSRASPTVKTNRTDEKEIETSMHEQPWQD